MTAESRAPGTEGGCDVTILLATYEGAAFLRPQLLSLATQFGVAWRLLWRDDGSSDDSVAIMREFAAERPPGDCVQLQAPAGRIGAAQAYYVLAASAAPGTCLAFCDQDDVWLPEKLARARAALRSIPPEIPALYFARQNLVDAALHRLGESPRLSGPPGFPQALTQNLATGCTVMLNGPAAALLRRAPPPPGTLHDWWSYLLVSAAGGRIIADDEPVVLYRQHGNNLVGAQPTQWRRAIAALRRGPAVFMKVLRVHVDALAALPLPPETLVVLHDLQSALGQGIPARLRVLRRYRLRRQKPLETALFTLWFLIG